MLLVIRLQPLSCPFSAPSPSTTSPSSPTPIHTAAVSFKCVMYCKSFASYRVCGKHMNSTHHIRSFSWLCIGDVAQCSICGVDSFQHVALSKLSSACRIRYRYRSVACVRAVLDLGLQEVKNTEFDTLETRDAQLSRSARRNGHTSVICHVLSIAPQPFIQERKAGSETSAT